MLNVARIFLANPWWCQNLLLGQFDVKSFSFGHDNEDLEDDQEERDFFDEKIISFPLTALLRFFLFLMMYLDNLGESPFALE